MSVCQMAEELEFVEEGETTYLYLPLAHVFALTLQLASYDLGTAIVYYGGNAKEILGEIIETKPTYVPSVPRIFEKLYAAAMKMMEQSTDEDKERFSRRSSSASRCASGASAARTSGGDAGAVRPGRRADLPPACAICSAAACARR